MPLLLDNKADLVRRVIEHHDRQTINPDIPYLSACDVVQSVPQTEVWIACQRDDGSWAVGQAKFCCYDVAVADYPAHRKAMHSGAAVRRARRWGAMVADDHPAYREVEALGAALGTSARQTYDILVIDQPATAHSLLPSVDAIVAAISQLVPLLDADGRQRVRALVG